MRAGTEFLARRRQMLFLMVALLVTGAMIETAGAVKGGQGGRRQDPGCSVSPSPSPLGETYVVSAWGLPADSAINLWVTDASGTVGRPLGSTPDGSFALNESSQYAGTTTYQFSGPERGNMKVYATCFAEAY